MNTELVNKVKNRIDEYIGFDSDELFNCGDLKIFGGAVRDSIADMPINDIDIICGAETAKYLEEYITRKGFTYMENLTPKDLSRLYSDLKIMNEPRTYMKGSIIIQVIRPVVHRDIDTPSDFRKHLDYMIENVDISCCGVSYDGQNIKESYPNAIMHCLCKIYRNNTGAIMAHPSRLVLRQSKLEERGWKFVKDEIDEINIIRKRNIEKLV